MLLSQQEEQYRYFYIDRKFVSGNLQLIHDALDEIDLFLAKMKKIDLINSLILRMVDLIPSTKSLVLKHRVASIFKHHSKLLLTIHCRDQIGNSLVKYAKSNDQLTRVVSLQIMSGLSTLFLKDIAVYHILLSKISESNSHSKVQKKEAIICLSIILTQSNQIGKLFAKNIISLRKIYTVPLHIILYLLSHINLQCHLQIPLLQQIMKIITNSNQCSISTNKKKTLKYLSKVVIKYAFLNYRVVSFYQRNFNQLLPSIEGIINKIKRQKYPFLNFHSMNNQVLIKAQTVESLIQELYNKKQSGLLLKEGQNYIQKLYSFIDDAFQEGQNIQRIVLLFYFVEDLGHYDRKMKKKITTNQIKPSKKLLQQLITVGCFESAFLLLNLIQLPQNNYIFIKTYLEFKLQKEPKSIDELKQIAYIIDLDIHFIIAAWEIIQLILKLWQISIKNSQLRKKLHIIYQSIKENKRYSQLIHIIKIVSEFGQNENVHKLKQKCFPFLPSLIMNTNTFWFAHLNKQTVINLFNTVL